AHGGVTQSFESFHDVPAGKGHVGRARSFGIIEAVKLLTTGKSALLSHAKGHAVIEVSIVVRLRQLSREERHVRWIRKGRLGVGLPTFAQSFEERNVRLAENVAAQRIQRYKDLVAGTIQGGLFHSVN